MLAFAIPPKAMKCGDGDVAQICDSLFCWCDYRIKNSKGKENVCDSWAEGGPITSESQEEYRDNL